MADRILGRLSKRFAQKSMCKFDRRKGWISKSRYRNNPAVHKSVYKLSMEMVKAKLFQQQPRRGFPSFPHFSSNLLKIQTTRAFYEEKNKYIYIFSIMIKQM